ncbi:MAG: alpha/beta fold hydrolase [Actinophytocola sp.]|nr:alpha/beta fold hydrolase [Actinophytocola sp.]
MSGLLLLHGIGLNRRMWRRCLDPLGTRHRVRALDLLGHGHAGPAPEGATVADLADDVASRMDGPAHVVGFSLGTMVAQQLALEHPALVRSLVLVSAVVDRSPAESAAVAERLALAERDFAAAADAAVDRWMPPAWQATDPDLAVELRATLLGTDHRSYLRCYRVFATADQVLWPRLPEIAAPTLAITGADDPGSTQEMTHRLADVIPGARAVIVPGVRHLLPMQAPDTLVQHILSHTTEVDHDAAAPQALHRR